jgi:hypothetical protein
MADLTYDDVDGLRDLADRSRRAAATARKTAEDSAVPELLTNLAVHLEAAAATADTIADLVERGSND